MVNKASLHLEANEIRNDRTTSFETKELLIDTLKKESGYQKDLELSDKKRSKHREQQDILTKLGEQGIDDQLVDSVRKSLYPGYDPSHKKYDESLEKVSDHIDAAYIDELLQTEGLHKNSKQQLENIKNLLDKNPNRKLNKDRLMIKNGFVVIDGFGLPASISISGKEGSQFYPDFAIALVNFTADAKGKQFDRKGLSKNDFTDRSLDTVNKLNLNTDSNLSILQSLSAIVDLNGYIPMGLDNRGHTIYVHLKPDSIGFYRSGRWPLSPYFIAPAQFGR